MYRLTGGLLRYIEGTPRRDNMHDKFEVISQDFISKLSIPTQQEIRI
jgi:hypothetical protein